jgi:uncharacterized protein YggU (UPF0235/DUF167 family)
MLGPAIRFFAAKGKAQVAYIQLLCHVKPGVNANREGIAAVSDEAIEVCVAAQAKEGEANKAVREVVANVSGSSTQSLAFRSHHAGTQDPQIER